VGGGTSLDDTRAKRGSGRAFRGLALVFLLSFLNLIGLFLTVTALGGVAPWSRWQFNGAFGVLEAASGLANVISPNIWRLPIAELQTSERTDVKLAGSALLLPHWGGLARCVAGLVSLAVAAWQNGLGPASAGLCLPSRSRYSRSRRSWRGLESRGQTSTSSSGSSGGAGARRNSRP